jgi:hypothetical protein
MGLKVTWDLERESGRPIVAEDIAAYRLFLQYDGAPTPDELAAPPVDVKEVDIEGAFFGGVTVTLMCALKNGVQAEASATLTVEDTSELRIVNLTLAPT